MYQPAHGYYNDHNKWIPGYDDGGMMTLKPNHSLFVRFFDELDVRPRQSMFEWFNLQSFPANAVNPEKRRIYVDLSPGWKAKATFMDKRRVIFIGTALGTLAVFEFRPAGSSINRILYCAAPELADSGLINMNHFDSPELLKSYILSNGTGKGTLQRDALIYAEAHAKIAR